MDEVASPDIVDRVTNFFYRSKKLQSCSLLVANPYFY